MAAAETFDFRRADHGRSEGKSLAWKLRRPVVPAAKRAIRRYGQATSSRRVLPDYLIIGAKRGGSTTLARNLVATPGVQGLFPKREDLKGTYFLDVNFDKGQDWYRSHFPTQSARGADVVGEASPYYLSHPQAPQRARQLMPDARIICVLRHPVDRAFSHYRERVKQGIETLPTFEAALDAEADRIDGEVERMLNDPSYVSWNHLNFAYRDQSRYGTSVNRWLSHWPREQLLVLRSEDLYADPAAVIARTRAFLGLPEVKSPMVGEAHHNRLSPGAVAPQTRQDLWTELFPQVDDLADTLGGPQWWDADGIRDRSGQPHIGAEKS